MANMKNLYLSGGKGSIKAMVNIVNNKIHFLTEGSY